MLDHVITQQLSVMQNARNALKYIDDELVGCEDQEKQIEDLVTDFISSKKGICCLLEGEPNCGRQSVLAKVLKSKSISMRVVNAGYLAADPTIQESLAREDDGDCSVFLVRDSDELLSAHQQEFLYTMVDKATTFSWLVFFSISRHNFSQNLEKRGNSRMPRIRIDFEQNANFEDYCSYFNQLMAPKASGCDKDELYVEILKNLNSKHFLRDIHKRYNYNVLKMIAAQLLMRIGYFCDEEDFKPWSEDDLMVILEESVDFAVPRCDRRLQILGDQTLRTQCVFFCVHRLVCNKTASGTTAGTTYRTVFLEYKKLANKYHTLLDVITDVYIFREIDHLVEIGLLKADKSTNVTNASFRKVWPDVDSLAITETFKTLPLPLNVRGFFETILQ